MREYLRFFLGTPRRFLATLGGIMLIICMVNPALLPGALAALVSALLAGLSPLLGPVMALLILFFGLRMIFRGFK